MLETETQQEDDIFCATEERIISFSYRILTRIKFFHPSF